MEDVIKTEEQSAVENLRKSLQILNRNYSEIKAEVTRNNNIYGKTGPSTLAYIEYMINILSNECSKADMRLSALKM